MTMLPSQLPHGQDPELVRAHARLQNDLEYYCRRTLKIKPKTGPLEPFVFNTAQRYLHERIEAQKKRLGKVRILIVKGRQQGCSTYVAARYYHRSTRYEGQSVFILSHESQTTEKLFSIVERYHENAPDVARPAAEVHNRRQLVFESLGSDYSVGTAGNENVGRGGTLQLFHGSEVAFWTNTDQIQTGILQSVPDLDDTEIILESTANGMANMFYDLVVEAEAGQNDYEVVFIPWYWQPEYRRATPANGVYELTPEEEEYCALYSQSPYEKIPLVREQVYWMRAKISEFRGNKWKFYQEYPAYLQQAFQTSGDSLISAEAVIRARKLRTVGDDHIAPLIIGVDPGRTRDRSVFVWRRGRKILKYKVFKFEKADKENITMVLAGKLADIIEKDNPDAIHVDVGDGTGVVDRLRELGHSDIVRGVYASEEPIDEQYLNKRAEMWGEMMDWFHGEEGPVECPDDDTFQRDICAMPASKKSSSGKTQMVSNEIIKQKFKMSLDIGSAAGHTFAYPVRRREDNVSGNRSRIRAKHPGLSPLKTLNKIRSHKRT